MKEADFRDHIRQLKDAVRGQDIVARLGLPGRGKRFFCPVYQPAGGKTPDLDIFDKGFKGYKCGMTGDVIDLAVMVGRMTKAEAIEYLETASMREDIDRFIVTVRETTFPFSDIDFVWAKRTDTAVTLITVVGGIALVFVMLGALYRSGPGFSSK